MCAGAHAPVNPLFILYEVIVMINKDDVIKPNDDMTSGTGDVSEVSIIDNDPDDCYCE